MKKWRNTILLTLSSAVLALTAHWWVPKLLPPLGIVFKNKETVGTFKDFVQIVAGIMTLALPFFKALRNKKEREQYSKPAPDVSNSSAGRDINVTGSSIQSGGVNAQGNMTFQGDAAFGSKKIVHGDLVEGDRK